GRAQELGYLGGLRVQPRFRHRIRHLREGYASIRPMATANGTLPWWFTVVASENDAARRLLEAGVRGLPRYRACGDYVMFGLPTARGRATGLWRNAIASDLQGLIEFHNARARALQFSPVLTEGAVKHIGLDRFVVHERDGAIAGVAALWNQQPFKQVVARRYRSPIGALVPAYNAYARIFRRIPLPLEGHALEMTFIAFLALDGDALSHGDVLVRDLLARCTTPAATLGLHAANPLAKILAPLRPMRYPSRVYTVSFDDVAALDQRPAQPEAALL